MKEDFSLKKENPSLNIDIFRHGEAKYDQGGNLTTRGIEDIKINAAELANIIEHGEEVAIWSSPVKRTLQTSEIIAQVLKERGICIRNGKIMVFKQLSEIRNFSWKLFNPLVVGGEVEFAGQRFFIKKNLTNPENMSSAEYFLQDGIGSIDTSYQRELPREYIQEIKGFENFSEVTRRLIKPLSRLKNLKDKPYRIIIVTHDALTGFIANVFSGGTMHGINPGEFINLERINDKLVSTRVGDLHDGNKSTDVIDAFNKK